MSDDASMQAPAMPDHRADGEIVESTAGAINAAVGRRSHGWLAVASLALGTFVMVTSEFLPIGLLPSIARDLRTSDSTAGLMVTVPGLVAAVAAPTIIVTLGSLDRRYLLWALSALLVVSNLIAAEAGDLPLMLFGRCLLGICVGGFWGIGAALAARLVTRKLSARALTIVFAGISIGTVLGMPTGAFVGHAFGWRVAFLTAAVMSVAVVVAQVVWLPKLPESRDARGERLFAVFSVPQARIGLICVVLVILGHFMAYTYITPFLEQRARVPSAFVSMILLAYGTAGFLGNLAAGALLQRNVRPVAAAFALVLGGALVVLSLLGAEAIPIALLVLVWGFAFGGIPICLQTWMFDAAPELMSSTSAVFVSVFQLALAGGSLLGGIAVAGYGVSTVMALGGGAAMASAIVMQSFGRISAESRAGRLAERPT